VIAALRYEWRRLTTLRSTWWLTAIGAVVTLGLALLIALAIASAGEVSEGDNYQLGAVATQGAAVGGVPLLVAYLFALLGVFCFGHEYRHGMIRATLTAVPSRGAVFAAKVLVTAAAAFLVGAVITLLGAGIALLVLSAIDGEGGTALELALGVGTYTALFALVGLALASLFRNQIASLVVVLVMPTVVEAVIQAVLVFPPAFDDVQFLARYLPFDAGSQLYVQLSPNDALDLLGYDPLGAVGGGLVFAGFTALLLAAAGVLFVRRDA